MVLSSVGRKKLAGQAAFLFFDVVVLALSARVNQFQDFFYVADIFPLALSIVSLVLVVILIVMDLILYDSYTSRPQFEIGFFGVLSIFWLAFNVFSTACWRQIPFKCNSIPAEFMDERVWCKTLQALKSFVWITFVTCIAITLFTLRYSISQYKRGNKHVFQMPLSRYRPEIGPSSDAFRAGRGSEFLQFEKLT
ncbi:unnamed protein product [Cyclocybe aegerita]|uniref:MARVEL domain-containing protein n=1 Tax=Cyclocybe aegerita TaxID=1973307 RepID=A0A8S0WIZ0_CYCAE|nr:unnamed protein product [Cyclocybe aegerita]